MRSLRDTTATITAYEEGVEVGKVSNAIEVPVGYHLAALILPIIETSTAIIFQVSLNGIDYKPLHEANARYSVNITNTGGIAMNLDETKFYNWRFIKIEVANAQTVTNRIFNVILARNIDNV